MNKIILIGMKACGKTTVGKLLADKLKIRFIELDRELEKEHQRIKKGHLTFREIFKKYGNEYFRNLETTTLKKIADSLKDENYVLACGGGTPLTEKNQKILEKLGVIIYLKPDRGALYQRIVKNGIPAFFSYPDDPKKSFIEILDKREKTYNKLKSITIESGTDSAEIIADNIHKYILSFPRPRTR